jgi:hypothetical protein
LNSFARRRATYCTAGASNAFRIAYNANFSLVSRLIDSRSDQCASVLMLPTETPAGVC